MSLTTLLFTLVFVVVVAFVSLWQKLGLERC